MIVQYPITGNSWTPITAAGQSGTCWLDEQDDGAAGQADVRIWHATTPPSGESKLTESKRVYKPRGNDDIMLITSDSIDDIFYARCSRTEDTATLSADVI